jgi:hypothetical protein
MAEAIEPGTQNAWTKLIGPSRPVLAMDLPVSSVLASILTARRVRPVCRAPDGFAGDHADHQRLALSLRHLRNP